MATGPTASRSIAADLRRPLALVALATLIAAAPALADDNKKKDAKAEKIVVQFVLDAPLTDAPTTDDPFAEIFAGTSPVSMRSLMDRMEKAAEDDKVAAVMLTLDQPGMTWSQALELRPYVKAIRDAGKPVVVYSDMLMTTDYVLAAVADKIVLNPMGGVELNGLFAQLTYMSQMLGKLGIEADFEQIGVAKGAAEPLTRTGPSDGVMIDMNNLLDDLYAQLADQVGKPRGLDGVKVLEGGPYTAEQALKAKVVDKLANRLDAIAMIKKRGGIDAKELDERLLVSDYGVESGRNVDTSNPFAIFSLFQPKARKAEKGDAVGIIYAKGAIMLGDSTPGGFMSGEVLGDKTLIRACEQARRDDSIKAVVIRVDSPGGSATASEAMWDAITALGKEKPVIVSVGNVAASGGYYIIAPADRIFVEESSIVGSIGILAGKLVMDDMFEMVGIDTHNIVRGGPQARLFDLTRKFTDEERQWLKTALREGMDGFVDRVKQGRGDKLEAFEAKIVGGKVFSGRQAVENGLADELGGFNSAIAYAARKAKLGDDYKVRVVPKPTSFIDELFKGMGGGKDDNHEVTSTPRLGGLLSLPQTSLLRAQLETLRRIAPAQADAIIQQITLLEIMDRDTMLMAMPFHLSISIDKQ